MARIERLRVPAMQNPQGRRLRAHRNWAPNSRSASVGALWFGAFEPCRASGSQALTNGCHLTLLAPEEDCFFAAVNGAP